MEKEKPPLSLSVAMILLLGLSSAVQGQVADCRDVPDGEVCDAANHIGDGPVLVSMGTVAAWSYRVDWGTATTPTASANGKHTDVHTGVADEVRFTAEADWTATFDATRNDYDDPNVGMDRAYFSLDWESDGNNDDSESRDCSLCAGAGYLQYTGVLAHTTGWEPTNWPVGQTYDAELYAEIVRWEDMNANGQWDGSFVDRIIDADTGTDTGTVRVGDLL